MQSSWLNSNSIKYIRDLWKEIHTKNESYLLYKRCVTRRTGFHMISSKHLILCIFILNEYIYFFFPWLRFNMESSLFAHLSGHSCIHLTSPLSYISCFFIDPLSLFCFKCYSSYFSNDRCLNRIASYMIVFDIELMTFFRSIRCNFHALAQSQYVSDKNPWTILASTIRRTDYFFWTFDDISSTLGKNWNSPKTL